MFVADKKSAAAFWAPRIANEGKHTQYDLAPDVPSVLIRGPYLVRGVSSHDSTLAITGDINGTTTVDVFGPSKYRFMTWNGKTIMVQRSKFGSLQGTIGFPRELDNVELPRMSEVEWSCANSLPELELDFDDSNWVLANKTSTKRPQQPFEGKVRTSTDNMKVTIHTDEFLLRMFSTQASEWHR